MSFNRDDQSDQGRYPPALRAVAAGVRAWTRLYTSGLPRRTALYRRRLIESDIWEQLRDGVGAISLARRCLSGLPADLSWRLTDARIGNQTAHRLRFERTIAMAAPVSVTFRYALLSSLSWGALLGLTLNPTLHSLAFAGALLVAISLAGWAFELRAVDEPASSVWPAALAVSIAVTATGLVLESSAAGPLVIMLLALASTAACLRRTVAARSSTSMESCSPALTVSQIESRVAVGQVLALERPEHSGISRRALLRGTLWMSLGSLFAAAAGVLTDFLSQRGVSGFGGVVTAGELKDFPAGSKTRIQAGKFWLVSLTEAEGGPGYLALWQKCPHLGCTVPWEQNFRHTDPSTGAEAKGWFRCPCHQSTYSSAGVLVYGPAPRSMDRMAVRITPEGRIDVDTREISKGTTDNATFAVRP